jgi:hypothetical protein
MALWRAPLHALFDSLCAGGPPLEAEVLFVFAGRQERKPYGLSLWRRGYAPTLVLSVARFEWRRFAELGLRDDGGLIDLVQRTPPEERHFFVVLHRSDAGAKTARAFRVETRGLGTWNEARALAEFLERERVRSVLVVSSASHLRRAVTTLRALAPREIRIDATAVPEGESAIARDDWWRTPRQRRMVLWEAVKLLLYRARLGWIALSGR